MKERNR